MISYNYSKIPTPVGELTLIASSTGLAAVLWEDDRPGRVPLPAGEQNDADPILVQARKQLEDYFAGKRRTFDLPLDPVGTPFQQKVWDALKTIPFGQTRSYGQLAAQVGNPAASRAVGAANGRNPLSIIVPCHRVIGSTGKLTGFAGGLAVKEKLLRLESATDSPELWAAAPVSTKVG